MSTGRRYDWERDRGPNCFLSDCPTREIISAAGGGQIDDAELYERGSYGRGCEPYPFATIYGPADVNKQSQWTGSGTRIVNRGDEGKNVIFKNIQFQPNTYKLKKNCHFVQAAVTPAIPTAASWVPTRCRRSPERTLRPNVAGSVQKCETTSILLACPSATSTC